MGCRTDRLLTLASPAFSAGLPEPGRFDAMGASGLALANLLAEKNGFTAYLSALTIYSADRATGPLSLEHLNGGDWRSLSQTVRPADWFFGSDLFGGLIAIRDGEIWRFDPENDVMEWQAPNLGQWQQMVADDPDGMVAYGDALAWRVAGHHLPAGFGLLARADGEFEECQIGTLARQLLAGKNPGTVAQATGFA